jgi:hypothetical protein
MPNCSTLLGVPAAVELASFLAARRETFRAKTFIACLSVVTLGIVLLPLIATASSSFGAARAACYDKTLTRLSGVYLDLESPYYDSDWDEGRFSEYASRLLFPMHLFNSVSTLSSLFGFWLWLFFSPHNSGRVDSNVAQDLDRTRMTSVVCVCVWCVFVVVLPREGRREKERKEGSVEGTREEGGGRGGDSLLTNCAPFVCLPVGSYFALQWLGNFLVTVSALSLNCNSSSTAHTVGYLVHMLASYALSGIVTNLLCHRYLCEKARVMIKL